MTLFFSKKFIIHRVVGLSYLVQFVASMYLYFANYDAYYNSILPWSMPLTGFSQSIIATFTFWFLPKKQKDPGYYGDKSTLSHTFVKENIFFSGLLFFQCVYMHDNLRPLIQDYIPLVLESSFVFLPYFVFRPFFEKTSFRDSLNVKDKNKTDGNRMFFIVVTYITKAFYIWAKHFIGFFLNYARCVREDRTRLCLVLAGRCCMSCCLAGGVSHRSCHNVQCALHMALTIFPTNESNSHDMTWHDTTHDICLLPSIVITLLLSLYYYHSSPLFRFMDRITSEQVRHIYLMLIFSGAATTISMFLHTLKFKKMIGPRTAYLWYMFSYLMTFYSWVSGVECGGE